MEGRDEKNDTARHLSVMTESTLSIVFGRAGYDHAVRTDIMCLQISCYVRLRQMLHGSCCEEKQQRLFERQMIDADEGEKPSKHWNHAQKHRTEHSRPSITQTDREDVRPSM